MLDRRIGVGDVEGVVGVLQCATVAPLRTQMRARCRQRGVLEIDHGHLAGMLRQEGIRHLRPIGERAADVDHPAVALAPMAGPHHLREHA
jgi:hypothetical protein